MKAHYSFILALSTTVAACGHSGQDLFLDQGSAALGCGAPGEPDCSSADDPSALPEAPPEAPSSDAGTPYERRCDVEADCEYGEVCEHRHGPNRCEPAGYDYDDHGGDEYGHDDDGTPDQGHGDTPGADAGTPAACDGHASDDGYASDDRCTGQDDPAKDGPAKEDPADDDAYGYDDHGGDHSDDHSGSNSGPH